MQIWRHVSSRWIFTIVMAGIFLLGGIMALAQEEMMQQLPAPDEHMQEMAWFIGNWNIKSRMLMDAAKDEWIDEDLHSIHTYELGGHLIFEHFFGPLGGEPFEAWSLRAYNESTGKWEQRWVDSSPGGFANWVGSYKEGEFMGFAQRFLDDEGNIKDKQAYREVFDNITEDSYAWRYEVTEDGGATWKVTWTLDYVRAD
jgi:hypothetical protein